MERHTNPQLHKCQTLMAGKVKELLEDIARKVESNKSSAFCVGDTLTIADITVGDFVVPFYVCAWAPQLKKVVGYYNIGFGK